MGALPAILGLLLLIGIAVAVSKDRRGIRWRVIGAADFGSIALGALGSLRAEMRALARVGVRALLAATLADLGNAAIAGLVFVR